MTYQLCQLCHFTAIKKSDGKVSIMCTLQNLAGRGHLGTFAYSFMSTGVWTLLLSHTVFHVLYSREVCYFSCSLSDILLFCHSIFHILYSMKVDIFEHGDCVAKQHWFNQTVSLGAGLSVETTNGRWEKCLKSHSFGNLIRFFTYF